MADDAPNFFILGAAKCGTTTLANALRRHPEIFIPEVKEPQFFSNDEIYRRGLTDYVARHFDGAGAFAARGDATPHYLATPVAARRIRESLPASAHRFIAIFRDPVERAYSLYWNTVYEGFEELSFEEALLREAERAGDPQRIARGSLRYRYFETGCYAQQLEAYFAHFARERFLLLFQEDLLRDPTALVGEVCAFLGVSAHHDLGGEERANPAGLARSKRLQRLLRNPHRLKEPAKRLLPERVQQWLVARLLQWNKRVVPYPEMRPETEARLRERYRADVEALARLTGRDLSHWLEGDFAPP